MQDDGNGVLAGWPAALEDGHQQALRRGPQAQAQRCGAGLAGLGRRAQHDEQGVALLGGQVKAAQ